MLAQQTPLQQQKFKTADQGIWFTSDSHQSHANIMKFCPRTRPYQDIHLMNIDLLERWNARVKPDDIVFHLGDFFFMRNLQDALEYVQEMNGKIFLVLGNHDQIITNNYIAFKKTDKFIGIEKKQNIVVDGQPIVLDHFPNAVWDRNHYGSWQLHGHTHGNYMGVGKQLDVGCDSYYFETGDACRPISFAEIAAYMATREKICLDTAKKDL